VKEWESAAPDPHIESIGGYIGMALDDVLADSLDEIRLYREEWRERGNYDFPELDLLVEHMEDVSRHVASRLNSPPIPRWQKVWLNTSED
jgi:hypothetical protein